MESSQILPFPAAVGSVKEALEWLYQVACLEPASDVQYIENLRELILLCENYFQIAEDDLEGILEFKTVLGVLLKRFLDRYCSDPMSEIGETLKNLAISTETTTEEQKEGNVEEKDKTE